MKLFEPVRTGVERSLKDFLDTAIPYIYIRYYVRMIFTENQPIELYAGLLFVSEIRAVEPMCYELIIIIGFKPESLISYQ